MWRQIISASKQNNANVNLNNKRCENSAKNSLCLDCSISFAVVEEKKHLFQVVLELQFSLMLICVLLEIDLIVHCVRNCRTKFCQSK